jgi:hypothetical protein
MLRYHFAMPFPRHRSQPTVQPSAARARLGALLAAALLVVFLLAACAAPGPVAERETGAVSGDAFFARGDYEAAAEAWQREAVDAAPQDASGLRVSAADAWLLAGQPERAEDVLRRVSPDDLTAPERARHDLVLADLALRRNRPDEADTLLKRAQTELQTGLPRSLETRYRTLASRLQGQLDLPGSRNLAMAAGQVEAMNAYDAAATQELLQTLENVSSGELAIRAANPRADRQLTGWLDLALVIRQNLVVPDDVAAAVGAWKARHSNHVLSESEALDAWLRYRQRFDAPRRTAVLAPGSGRLKSAGEAIRDGLMSAYAARPGGSEVLFFPTSDETQSVVSAYFNALDAGADQIIGPLRKESVEAMLGLAGLATPVLALNDLPDGFVSPAGLTGQISGLSLSQEAEVTAIAAHAAASGFQRAMVLVPESAWGERMALIFQDEFLRDDRQIVTAMRYLEEENDHSALLERALRIDESKARAERLENTLQVTIEYEPVRRTDVDVIFLAANGSQAKQLRPQLRFHDAGDIPVYASGRIYSGEPDPARNEDLDGVRFPTTPWELTHSRREEIPGVASLKGGAFGALFAVGQDAWNVLPWLRLMRKDPGFVFPGASGHYRMDAAGRLQREPAWAVFVDGRPRKLPPPQAMAQAMQHLGPHLGPQPGSQPGPQAAGSAPVPQRNPASGE